MFIILIPVIAVLIFFAFTFKDYDGGSIVAALFGTAVLSFFAALFTGLTFYGDGPSHYTHRSVQLQNLADRMSVSGDFFLFAGSIGGDSEYAWYEQTGPNTYKQKSVSVEYADIHYILDGSPPHYVVTTQRYSSTFILPWGLNFSVGEVKNTHWDFYIPRGSITHTYKLDAQ